MEEIWKPIAGYENRYEVSSLGKIRSVNRYITNKGLKGRGYTLNGKQLKVCKANNGYYVVNLGRKTHFVHRLVCEAFIGTIPKGMTVNHKDGNKANNRAENLEWLTIGDNIRHGFKTGLYKSAQKRVTLQKESGEKLLFQSMSDADKYLKRATGYVSGCLKLGRFPKSSSGETYIVELEEIDDGIKAAIDFK